MKVTIEVSQSLNEVKRLFSSQHGDEESPKVTNGDISNWFSDLVQKELDSIQEDLAIIEGEESAN